MSGSVVRRPRGCQTAASVPRGRAGISAGSIRSAPHTGLGGSGSRQEGRGPGLTAWSPQAGLWPQPRTHTRPASDSGFSVIVALLTRRFRSSPTPDTPESLGPGVARLLCGEPLYSPSRSWPSALETATSVLRPARWPPRPSLCWILHLSPPVNSGVRQDPAPGPLLSPLVHKGDAHRHGHGSASAVSSQACVLDSRPTFPTHLIADASQSSNTDQTLRGEPVFHVHSPLVFPSSGNGPLRPLSHSSPKRGTKAAACLALCS